MIIPLGNRVAVKAKPINKDASNSAYVADQYQVMYVGDSVKGILPGDFICFCGPGGLRLDYNGEEYYIVNCDCALAVIREPND